VERRLMHPADIAELPAPVTTPPPASTLLEGIEIVPDRFGVLQRGEMLVLPEPMPVCLPPLHYIEEPPDNDRLTAFRYAMMAMPKPPRYFVGIDLAAEAKWTPRQWWLARIGQSLKQRILRQRRLDRFNTARRIKRRRELARRGRKVP
jgi:hypothetical protein